MSSFFRHQASSPFVYDIPLGLRRLAWTAGLSAVVVVIVASLEGGQDKTIEVDKLLHFGGYAVLGLIFTMSLKPAWIPPCLLLLVGLGVGIELLQPLNGRTKDVSDAIANTIGLVSGCSLGLFLRVFSRHFFTGLKGRRWRKSLFSHAEGEVLVEQGQVPDFFYILRSGCVELFHTDGQGDEQSMAVLSSGTCIGVAAALKQEEMPVTLKVKESSEIYHIRKEQFFRETGDESEALKFLVLSMADTITSFAEEELLAHRAGGAAASEE